MISPLNCRGVAGRGSGPSTPPWIWAAPFVPRTGAPAGGPPAAWCPAHSARLLPEPTPSSQAGLNATGPEDETRERSHQTTCKSEVHVPSVWKYLLLFLFQLFRPTCVTSGDPLHSVDSRLTMVDTWLLSLESGAEGAAPVEVRPGLQEEAGPDTVPPAAAMRDSSSSVRPCLAKGAGSTPRRVNRSANEAKQRRAPSDTWRTRRV